ncbi:universal stress protein [Spirosoma sp. SC4-14]|uniref:universal stress protein n=1 Tax=Spirosoma sp. SC4-14 TaxID=3128900 RepID=UPI0030D56468
MENITINRILVPIDYSDTSTRALALAAAMSQRHNAVIRLLHIINPDQYVFSSGDGLSISLSSEEVIEAEVPKLHQWADEKLADLPVRYFVECRTGVISDRIADVARDFGADLIVMGAHGTSGIREYLMGSEAYRVLKVAPCPVLTVPGTFQNTDFQEILFPVRPVPGALDKYEYARRIIRKNKAHLTVLGLFDRHDAHETDPVTNAMSVLDRQLAEDSIDADILLAETDSVAKTVLRKSEDLHASLIIITATLDTPIRHFFVGPFARQIVNRAKVPVLSIQPEAPVIAHMQPTASRTLQSMIPSFNQFFPPVQLG